MRRWRHLPVRRGRFWGPPPNAVVPPAIPQVTRPAGSLRTPARLLPSRRRSWSPPQQPLPPLPFIRPSGSLKFAARLLPSRRRRSDPGWGQGSQGQAWPSLTEPSRPWRGLKLRRGASWPLPPTVVIPVTVTATAAGVVTPQSLAVPSVTQTGSWWQVLVIRKHAQEEFEFYAERPPMACPRCGEPLLNAPPTDAGSSVELYCRFDGWRYPEDWVRPQIL